MIRFFAISHFSEQLKTLLKIKRGVYSTVKDEICTEFKNKTIEQIRSNKDMILIANESIIIKLRLPDKKHKLAKKDGYRLIYMVSKTTDTVILLDIYPKRGPLQRISISTNDLTTLLNQFITELQSNTLTIFDL